MTRHRTFDPMPAPPPGATVEQLAAWSRDVLDPWVTAQRAREDSRSHNGRETAPVRQRVERRDWFARQVASIDRAALIAGLDEVDPLTLLNGNA